MPGRLHPARLPPVVASLRASAASTGRRRPKCNNPEPTGWQYYCETMTADCDEGGKQPAYCECPAHLHRKRATGLAAQVRRALAAGRLFAAPVTFRCHRIAIELLPRGLGVVALACLPQAA